MYNSNDAGLYLGPQKLLIHSNLFVDNAVDWLSGHMKGRYCNTRLKNYKEEKDPWPPIKTKSYVTLSLVHQKELQTRQETTATITYVRKEIFIRFL